MVHGVWASTMMFVCACVCVDTAGPGQTHRPDPTARPGSRKVFKININFRARRLLMIVVLIAPTAVYVCVRVCARECVGECAVFGCVLSCVRDMPKQL